MNFLPGFFLLGLSWLQPMHIFPWVSWHSEILAFLAVLAIGWESVYLASKNRTSDAMAFPFAALPIFVLGAVIGLQWFFGLIDFGGDVIVHMAYLMLCTAAIALGFTAERGELKPLFVLASAIVIGAVCSAFIAFAQAFEVWESFEWIHRVLSSRRSGANLAQPNQLATLLLMGIASLVYLFETRKLGAVLASVLCGVLLFALAGTESRAGVLGYLTLNVWWLVKRKSMAAQLKPWTVVLFGVMYSSAYWYWPTFMGMLHQLPGGVLPVNTVAFNRWIIWPQLVQAVLLHPWFGWGMGQVSNAHNSVVDAYSVSEVYSYAHNIVLDFALGIGIPLTILFSIGVGVWLWRRVRVVRSLGPWYCLAVVIPFLSHSLVEFPFSYSYFLLPVMFAIGALDGQLRVAPAFKLTSKPTGTGLLILTIGFLWSVVEYVPIEEDFRVVRFESLHVGETPAEYQKPKVYLFTQLGALLSGFRVTPKPNMPMEEIELLRKVAMHFPSIATQNRYALALALNNNVDEATRQLKVMRAQHGAKAYAKIKASWVTLANEKYPQLNAIELP